MLQYIKNSVLMGTGLGFGFLFEVNIFLKRFLEIFYLEETEVINDEFSSNYNENILLKSDELIVFKDFSAYWSQLKNKNLFHPQSTDLRDFLDVKQIPSLEVLPALSNINISIKRGELLCVVGKIGSGKTTLL